jgi:hypothetical protein
MAPKKKKVASVVPTASSASNRTLKRSASEAIAVKACVDNFKGWSSDEVYVQVSDGGTTIFNDVVAAVRKKKEDKTFKMGSYFYKNLKLRRARTDANKALFTPPSPPEVVPVSLMKAMIAAKQRSPNHNLMVAWIASNTPPNTTSLIGVCRWACSLNPKLKKHINATTMFVRFVDRVNLASTHRLFFQAIVGVCDRTMSATWSTATAKNVANPPDAAKFSHMHYGSMCTAVGKAPLDRVLAVLDKNYSPVIDAINEIVSSGDAGLDVWGFALVGELGKKVSKMIDDDALVWIKTGELTCAGFNATNFKILEKVNALENIDLLPELRDVVKFYSGDEFLCKDLTIAQEVSVALSFAWRPIAVSQGVLIPLWLEAMVNPTKALLCDRKIECSLAAQANYARLQLNPNFATSLELGGDVIIKNLLVMRHEFDSIDPDFEADVLLIKSIGGLNSELALIRCMHVLLPNGTSVIAAETVLQQLVALTSDNKFRLASAPARAKHAAFQTVLMKIVGGKCPDLEAMQSDVLLRPLIDLLPNLCSFSKAASSDATVAEATTFGLAALNDRLQKVQKMITDNEIVGEADVADFITFAFVIPAASSDPFKTAVAAARRDGSKRLKKSKTEKKDVAVTLAMGMFT